MHQRRQRMERPRSTPRSWHQTSSLRDRRASQACRSPLFTRSGEVDLRRHRAEQIQQTLRDQRLSQRLRRSAGPVPLQANGPISDLNSGAAAWRIRIGQI